MYPPNDLTSIGLKKIKGQDFNQREIRKFAAKYGVIASLKDTPDFLFINFTNITSLDGCINFFKENGFDVEESRRNKPQDAKKYGSRSFGSKENSKSCESLRPNVQQKNERRASNSSNQSVNGSCIVCQRQTPLFCQRCRDFYCSVECQLKDWQSHRYICFPIPKLIDDTQWRSQLHMEIQPLIQSNNLIQQQMQPLIGPQFIPFHPVAQQQPQQQQLRPNTNNQNASNNKVVSQQAPLNLNKNQSSNNNNNQQVKQHNNSIAAFSKQSPSTSNKPDNKSNNNSTKKDDKTVVNTKDLDKKPSPTPSRKSCNNPNKPTNTSLQNKTQDTLDKLERLRILQGKNLNAVEKGNVNGDSSPKDEGGDKDDDDEIDPSTLAFLKTIAENSKIDKEKGSRSLSRSSSLKSVCPNIPSNLQGLTKFPESRSLCIVVGQDLIRSSVFIRPCSAVAAKEYNEIIELVAERGAQAPALEKRPKLGDQVLGFHKGIYCRALVVNFVSIDEIFMFFIDTGEQDYLKLKDLRTMPAEFKKLKKYIFNIKLRNCSGNFGQSSQQFMQALIDNANQVRLEYNGVHVTNSSMANEVVVDLYNHVSNEHINERLRRLQGIDDSN